MECKYVHVRSYLMNICVGQNIHFLNDSHFKTLHQSKCCVDIIDNGPDAPICVMKDDYKETKLNFRNA